MTVDSTPTSQSPPSHTASARVSISASAYSYELGLGKPEMFADGAARGQESAIILLAIGFDGIRIATVSRFPLVTDGISSRFGSIMVKGPGQNASANFFADSGTSRAIL